MLRAQRSGNLGDDVKELLERDAVLGGAAFLEAI